MSARDDAIESLEDALEQVERENTELKKQITTLRAQKPTPTPPKETTTMSTPTSAEYEALKKEIEKLKKQADRAEERAAKLQAENDKAAIHTALHDVLAESGLEGASADIAYELLAGHASVNERGEVEIEQDGLTESVEDAVQGLRKGKGGMLWSSPQASPARPRGSTRRNPAPTTPDGKTDWNTVRQRFAGGLAVALDGADE